MTTALRIKITCAKKSLTKTNLVFIYQYSSVSRDIELVVDTFDVFWRWWSPKEIVWRMCLPLNLENQRCESKYFKAVFSGYWPHGKGTVLAYQYFTARIWSQWVLLVQSTLEKNVRVTVLRWISRYLFSKNGTGVKTTVTNVTSNRQFIKCTE